MLTRNDNKIAAVILNHYLFEEKTSVFVIYSMVIMFMYVLITILLHILCCLFTTNVEKKQGIPKIVCGRGI